MGEVTLAVSRDARAKVCPWCKENGEKVILEKAVVDDPLLARIVGFDVSAVYECPQCEYHSEPYPSDEYDESPDPLEYQLAFKNAEESGQESQGEGDTGE